MSYHAVLAVNYHSRTSGAQRSLLTVIAIHADEDGGHSFPSLQDMITEAHLSERSVWSALKSLFEMGELVRSGVGFLADEEHPYCIELEGLGHQIPLEDFFGNPEESVASAVSVETVTNTVTNYPPVESADFAPGRQGRVQILHSRLQESADFALSNGKSADFALSDASKHTLLYAHVRDVNLTPELRGSGDGGDELILTTRPPNVPGNTNTQNRAPAGASTRPAALVGAYQWLHQGACDVLGRSDLSPGQHERVAAFHDEHVGSPKLTEELVLYATGICRDIDKRDLRYWLGIIGKRLADPAWVDVPTERATSPYARKDGNTHGPNGQGTGTGSGGLQAAGGHYSGFSESRLADGERLRAALHAQVANTGPPPGGS